MRTPSPHSAVAGRHGQAVVAAISPRMAAVACRPVRLKPVPSKYEASAPTAEYEYGDCCGTGRTSMHKAPTGTDCGGITVVVGVSVSPPAWRYCETRAWTSASV